MAIDMSQFFQIFFEEAAEHLSAMESLLLGMDLADPGDEALNAVFRAAHSIKGGSGTFGFKDMAALMHEAESLLDRVRKHEIILGVPMVDALLEAGDIVRAQLACHRGESTVVVDAVGVVEKLRLLGCGPAQSGEVPPAAARRSLNLHFRLAARGSFDELLARLARHGEITALSGPDAGANCSVGLLCLASDDRIAGLLEHVAVPGSARVEHADVADDPGYGLFAEDVSTLSGEKAQADFGLFDDMPSDAPVPDWGRRQTDHPQVTGESAGRRVNDRLVVSRSGEAASIRVNVAKVDQLINLVGELVITQAMLAQKAALIEAAGGLSLSGEMSDLERNMRELQDAVMSIRMLPMSSVFNRFPRMLRDLTAKLGKKVELKTHGEQTELDKGVIEKITDPLNHLLRNCVDHGIEMPEARVAAGKPAHGTLTLRACHQGGSIVIEVADDGRGLDRERILAKAAERGLRANSEMSDQQVWQLIFEPGFSTAEEVTELSGRGVGMDVVKKNIVELGGSVELDSSRGCGTRVIVRLPLTLAIIDGMSVKVGGETYVVPLGSVVELLQPGSREIRTVTGQGRVIEVRAEYLPVISLASVFGGAGQAAPVALSDSIIVIVELDGAKTALLVDDLVGQHQVVVKSIEDNYRHVPGVSGATIMADGRVALIIDVAALVSLARH